MNKNRYFVEYNDQREMYYTPSETKTLRVKYDWNGHPAKIIKKGNKTKIKK